MIRKEKAHKLPQLENQWLWNNITGELKGEATRQARS